VSAEGRYFVVYPIQKEVVERSLKEALKGWVPDKAVELVVDEVLRRVFFHEAVIVGWGGSREERALKMWKELSEEMRKGEEPDWKETRLIKVIKVAKLERQE